VGRRVRAADQAAREGQPATRADLSVEQRQQLGRMVEELLAKVRGPQGKQKAEQAQALLERAPGTPAVSFFHVNPRSVRAFYHLLGRPTPSRQADSSTKKPTAQTTRTGTGTAGQTASPKRAGGTKGSTKRIAASSERWQVAAGPMATVAKGLLARTHESLR
jgi:hypothetical protein